MFVAQTVPLVLLSFSVVAAQVARDDPSEDVQHFLAGMTAGRSDLINSDIGQSGCVDLANNHLDFYCAVNWEPGPVYHDVYGNPIAHGRCLAIEHPCGAVVPQAGTKTRPLVIPDAPQPPLAPANSGAAKVQAAPSFQDGFTSGRFDLLDDDLDQSGCVDLADNHLDFYCAVNWVPTGPVYHDVYGSPIPHGRCIGVEPPCGAVMAQDGTKTQPLVAGAGGAAPLAPSSGGQPDLDPSSSGVSQGAGVDEVYACGMADLASLFSQIEAVCCVGQGEDCSDAPPSTCGNDCRVIMQLAWSSSDCKDVLARMPDSSITAFAELCSTESQIAPPAPVAGPSGH